jgi:hypothetical protein
MMTGVWELIELSGKDFENTRDLAGGLLGAKNAGLQICPN